MNKFLLLILAFILFACASPQVTVTSAPTECCAKMTVTSPPPTATLIPTPTLHPQFIAVQEQVASTGERFTLKADGTVEDKTAGGVTSVPGLKLDKNGVWRLSVGGEQIELKPADVSFDNDKGVAVNGYMLGENGMWAVESPTIALLNKYEIDPSTYTLREVDGVMVGTDNETGKEIFRDGRFEIGYAVELAKKDCEPTDFDFVLDNSKSPIMKDRVGGQKYIENLLMEVEYRPEANELLFYELLVDIDKKCWAFVDTEANSLLYRKKTRSISIIPMIPTTFQ